MVFKAPSERKLINMRRNHLTWRNRTRSTLEIKAKKAVGLSVNKNNLFLSSLICSFCAPIIIIIINLSICGYLMNAARSKIWNSYAVQRSSVIFYLACTIDVYSLNLS